MIMDNGTYIGRNRGGHVRFGETVYIFPTLRISRDDSGVTACHTLWGPETDTPGALPEDPDDY